MCVHEKMRIKKEKKSIRVFPNKPANPYIPRQYFFDRKKSEFKYMYCDINFSVKLHNVYNALNQWLLWNLITFCLRQCIYCMCKKHCL